jgi:hypothetical protein
MPKGERVPTQLGLRTCHSYLLLLVLVCLPHRRRRGARERRRRGVERDERWWEGKNNVERKAAVRPIQA